jgi:hypothetical protein
MPNLDPKPDPIKRVTPKGISRLARMVNQVTRNVLRQLKGGGDTNVSYLGDRVLIQSQSLGLNVPGIGAYLGQFKVIEEFDDYLKCQPYIPPVDSRGVWFIGGNAGTLVTEGLPFVFIAKPPPLRRIFQESPYFQYTGIGKRRQKTAFLGYIDQVIYPSYGSDVINAVRGPTGFTDPITNGPVVWSDLNASGRIWKDIPRASGCLIKALTPQNVSSGTYFNTWDTVAYDTDSYLPVFGQGVNFPFPGLYHVDCTAEVQPPTSGSMTFSSFSMSVEYFPSYTSGPKLQSSIDFRNPPSFNPAYLKASGVLNVGESAFQTNNNYIARVALQQITDWSGIGPPPYTIVNNITLTLTYLGSTNGTRYI